MATREKCRILHHHQIGSNCFKLILSSEHIAHEARPGQFVMVKCSDGYDPLLRRPISLHRISKRDKTIELLYNVEGKGSELLSNFTSGSAINLFGPLGNGFNFDLEKEIHIFVGGGMGIAPLLSAVESLKEHKKTVYCLIGAKDKNSLPCNEEFRQFSENVLFSTDDGSYGKKGYVSDILLGFINELPISKLSLSTIYACGPKTMLKAVAEIAFQKKIDCQISMEERMACGIGACKGCAVKTTAGYKMVCKDGPVFRSNEIAW